MTAYNLSEGVQYDYYVGSNWAWSDTFAFTAPRPWKGDGDTWRLIAIADLGAGPYGEGCDGCRGCYSLPWYTADTGLVQETIAKMSDDVEKRSGYVDVVLHAGVVS